MLFSVGTKVRFLHTGDEGVITKILSDTMVQVLIGNAFEIPASIENIRRAEEVEKRAKKGGKKRKRHLVKSQSYSPSSNRPPVAKKRTTQQTPLITHTGIHIVFKPQRRSDGTTAYFDTQIVNDTNYNVVCDFVFKLRHQKQHAINLKIDSGSHESLYHFPYDDLNNAPSVEIELLQLTTAGIGQKFQKNLKIKARQFFKKVGMIPIIKEEGHIYTLLNKFADAATAAKPKEDLKTYTKTHRQEKKQTVLKDNLYTLHKILDKAEFADEIDLHIEALTANHENLSNAEKLRLQIKIFEDYLDQAIRLGVDKVYIIHGLGTGRLKNEVTQRLIRNPYVKSFNNDHHPKYVFGATAVFLD